MGRPRYLPSTQYKVPGTQSKCESYPTTSLRLSVRVPHPLPSTPNMLLLVLSLSTPLRGVLALTRSSRTLPPTRLHTSIIEPSYSYQGESKRLQKARLRIAEAQGIIPIGASEDSNFDFQNYSLALSSSTQSISKVTYPTCIQQAPINHSIRYVRYLGE